MKNLVSISIDDLIAFRSFKNHFPDILKTPNIDRLMGLGVSFDNAFAQVALCNPSRTSILTGLRPEETGVHNNNAPWYQSVSVTKTLPYILAESGFDTSVIGKVYHQPADQLPGAQNLPFATFSDELGWSANYDPIKTPFEAGIMNIPAELHGDYVNTTEAVRQIGEWDDDGGNALFLGIFRPHAPYTAPKEFFDLYPLDSIPLPETLGDDLSDVPNFMRQLISDWYHESVVAAGMWKPLLQAYFAGVSFADAQVGRLLDTLESGGRLDDTAVMLWSDHGYHLGDKEHWHKFTLWEEAARAALIIYDPDNPATGRQIDTPVELLDIMPTALDILDVAAPTDLQGKSLAPFLTDGPVPTQGVAFTSMHGSIAIRTESFRFILYEDNSTELYDIVADPNQWTNLSGRPAYAGREAELRAALLDNAQENGWVRAVGDVDLSRSTEGHTVVFPNPSATVLGGTGDDVYFVRSQLPNIVEHAGGGVDTIYFRNSVQMPDNVENAIGQLEKGSTQDVQVTGNAGSNVITVAKRVWGMAGDDVISLTVNGFGYGGDGNDVVTGWNGSDRMEGGAGNDSLYGRLGDDAILGAGGSDYLVGDAGNDTLWGGDGNDVFFGGDGNDQLFGGAGNDTIAGGNGNDSLDGADGNDRLDGGADVDSLFGGEGDDSLYGQAGNDLLQGGGGTDRLDGFDGIDTVSYADGTGAVRIDLVAGSVTFPGSVLPAETLVSIESAIGSGFNDVFVGSAAANRLDAGLGEDVLYSGGGNDALDGDGGADMLQGGSGADVLIGAAGTDLFRFAAGDSVPGAADTLRAHSGAAAAGGAAAFEGPGAPAIDRIDLSPIDANTSVAGDQAFAFGSATGIGRLWLVEVGANTVVRGNVNATAAWEFELVIEDSTVRASDYGPTDFDF